jgi:hypothetical protein
MSELQQHENNVVQFRSVDDLRRPVISKWTEVDNVFNKFKVTRLDLAYLLLELKTLIDNGEAGELVVWWEWFDDNIGRSKEYAEKLLALAKSENPAAKYEEQMARERHRRAADKVTRIDTVRRGIQAVMGSADTAIGKNNQTASTAYSEIVTPSEPEREQTTQAERDEVEAVIRMIGEWRRPMLRHFIVRLKRIWREIF